MHRSPINRITLSPTNLGYILSASSLCLAIYLSILLASNYRLEQLYPVDAFQWDPSFNNTTDPATPVLLDNRLQQALSVAPFNSVYHSIQGRFISKLVKRYDSYDAECESGEAELNRALSLRPSWAPYWLQLLRLQYQCGQDFTQLENTIANIEHYGSWFLYAQREVITLGMMHYQLLSENTQQTVHRIYGYALSTQPRWALWMAQSNGFESWYQTRKTENTIQTSLKWLKQQV